MEHTELHKENPNDSTQNIACSKPTLEKTISKFLQSQPKLEAVLQINLPIWQEKILTSVHKETKKEKRPLGRPRIHPKPDPNAPKRAIGRPRIHPKPDPNTPKKAIGRPRIHPKPDPNTPKKAIGRPRIHPKPAEILKKTEVELSTEVNPEEDFIWHLGEELTQKTHPEEGVWHWPDLPEENIPNLDNWASPNIDDFAPYLPDPEDYSPKKSKKSIKAKDTNDPDEEEIPEEDSEVNEKEDKEEEDKEEEDPPKKKGSKGKEGEEETTGKKKDSGGMECLDIYYRDIRNNPPLTLEEEQNLSRKYKNNGCLKSRDKLALANLKFVVHIAKRFRGMLRMFSSGLSFEDIISEGNIGLLKAIERYEPERGNKVSTYASWWIVQQIQAGIQSKGKLIRIPTHLLQKMRKIQRIIDEYTLEHLKEDETLNLAEHVPPQLQLMLEGSGFKLEDAVILKNLKNISSPGISLDETSSSGKSNEGGEGPQLHESLEDENAPNPFQEMAISTEANYLADIIQTLSLKEQEILKARFGLQSSDTQTLEEVGKTHNLTRERIRQIQDRALKKLKTRILERRKVEETKH